MDYKTGVVITSAKATIKAVFKSKLPQLSRSRGNILPAT